MMFVYDDNSTVEWTPDKEGVSLIFTNVVSEDSVVLRVSHDSLLSLVGAMRKQLEEYIDWRHPTQHTATHRLIANLIGQITGR